MDIEQTLSEIATAAADVAAAEAAVTDGKQRLHRTALRGLVGAEGDDELARLVARLYWTVPELTVRSLAAVVGSDNEVRAMAGPGPSIPPCAGCGEERAATSRSQLANPPLECTVCAAARQRREREEWQHPARDAQEREEREEWLQHLRFMHLDEEDQEAWRDRDGDEHKREDAIRQLSQVEGWDAVETPWSCGSDGADHRW
jgi:hypothetical protein